LVPNPNLKIILEGWFPITTGGHIEVGETAEEAIIREAKELNVILTKELEEAKESNNTLAILAILFLIGLVIAILAKKD
jgi:hypothetical protein